MTPDEIRAWIERHSKLFPGFGTYASQGGEALVDVLAQLFADVTLVDANAASDRLYADPELRPRSYADHPPAVARIAKDLSAARGETTRRVDYERCSWGRCTMPGVHTASTSGQGPWYCRFHWWCHMRDMQPTVELLREWRDMAAARDPRGTLLELQLSEHGHWMCLHGEAEPLRASKSHAEQEVPF